MTSKPSHLVWFTLSGWGHMRPYVHMAMNLLGSFPDLHITFLADRRALKRIPQELSAYPELVKRFKGRYRVVPMTDPNGPEIPDADQDEIGKEVASVFESILERIFKGDKDAESEAFRAVPSATIVDIMRVPQFLNKSREIAERLGLRKDNFNLLVSCPTLNVAWQSYLDDVITMNRMEESHPEDKATQEKFLAEVTELDILRQRPDLPEMRNFELVPQLGSRGGDLKHDWMIRQMLMQPVLKADGMITMGTPEIEPNATKSVPEMMGMPLYSLGFAMTEASGPEEVPAVMNNPQIPTDDGKVRKFLDNCETRFGKRSVAYVSFGSFCWPSGRPEIVDYLVTSILTAEPPLALLLGMAAPDASLSDETTRLIEESGRALTCSWIPQRIVLHHPATSFFVTHGGAGSVYEGILANVPMVGCPQYADQPIIAAFVDHLGIGTQLFQFTTGHEGRTFANGVKHVGTEQAIKNEMAETWKKLRGKEGDEMRAKLARLGRTVTDSWERGEARESMMELGKVIMA